MKLIELFEERNTKSFELITEATTDRLDLSSMNFALGQIFPYDAPASGGAGGRTWSVGLGVANEVAQFDNEADARRFVTALQDSDDFKDYFENGFASERTRITTGELTKLRTMTTTNGGRLRTFASGMFNAANRMAQRGSYLTIASLENARVIGPTLRTINNSRWWKTFFRCLGALGLTVSLYTSIIGVINDIETEADRGEMTNEEALELRNILLGQLTIQVLAFWVSVFRSARSVSRVISIIRWGVRAAQGATAATGVGIPFALGSFLLTEAGFWAIQYIITSPTIQRAIAEWLQGNMFGDIVGVVGMGTAAAINVANEVFDGQYGTGALRRAIGFEEGQNEEVAGEVYASSEWAKLVFHNLLFPSNERILVPYISPDRREQLINEKLEISELPTAPQAGGTGATAPGDQGDGTRGGPAPAPTATSEPGLPTNPDARPGPQ